MCLQTNQEKPDIATEDIVVWKVINLDNTSCVKGFKYKPNKKYKQWFGMKHIKPVYKHDIGKIERAFHSYPTIPHYDFNVDGYGTKNMPFFLRAGLKLVKFIIPKGAKYYTGYDQELILYDFINRKTSMYNHGGLSHRHIQVPFYASNMIISGDLQDECHLIESLTSLGILGLNEYGEITEEQQNAMIDRLIKITEEKLLDKK